MKPYPETSSVVLEAEGEVVEPVEQESSAGQEPYVALAVGQQADLGTFHHMGVVL